MPIFRFFVAIAFLAHAPAVLGQAGPELHASPSSASAALSMDEALAKVAKLPSAKARGVLALAVVPPQASASQLARLSRAWADTICHPDRDPAAAKTAARHAYELAQQAVKLDPKNAQARLALGIGCGEWTDYVDAKTKVALSRQVRDEVEAALALDPRLDMAYHVLGRWHLGLASVNSLFRLGARLTVGQLPPASMEEAVKNLEKAVELAPQRIIYHQYLAQAYKATGCRNDAHRQWQQILPLPAKDDDDEAAKREAQTALKR